jgi:putative ABC transport system substrate-binding protein
MQRREFITLVGGAAAAWPLGARAQQPKMAVIGFLHSGAAVSSSGDEAAFRQGLKEAGYEGQNLRIEFRWAEGEYDRLTALAADLVRQQVAVIAAFGNVAARAAKTATATVPIIFTTGDDPVAAGLVFSLRQPSGNVTGVTLNAGTLPTKRLELLHELVPAASVFAMLVNPTNANSGSDTAAVQLAARGLGLQIAPVLKADSAREFESVFATLVQVQAKGLLISPDALFSNGRNQIAALAERHAMPTIYNNREYAEAGGLMSYGSSRTDSYRQAGIYVGKILKGAAPADLPVMQPTKFELVINLKTAKALGLTVPPTMLTRADEVIE